MRTFAARRPMPARLARATSRASGSSSTSHTVTPVTGSSSARASPIAPEPVPRSTTVTGRGSDRARSMAIAGDDLGLRPGDQHPPVDGEVEVAERPPAEHVGERLTGGVAGDHRVEVGDHALGRRLVEHVLDAVGAAGHLAQPAGRRALADPRGRLGEQRPPGDGARRRPRQGASASWRARSSAASAATTSSRSPASTSARR